MYSNNILGISVSMMNKPNFSTKSLKKSFKCKKKKW